MPLDDGWRYHTLHRVYGENELLCGGMLAFMWFQDTPVGGIFVEAMG